MAATFSSSLLSTPFITSPNPKPFKYAAVIRCGPRGKRGPLVKGRVLSIEAIQAVQALKRLTRSDDTSESNDAFVARTLSRLIKNDLVAAMDELLRQDHCDLALKVFDTIKSEYAVGLDKYAGMVNGLGRRKMWDEIDGLVRDLDGGGMIDCVDEKSVVKMLKAMTESGRAESLAMMYEIMKRSGWGVAARPDEYTVRVLSRGLRRLGKVKLADEVEAEFGTN